MTTTPVSKRRRRLWRAALVVLGVLAAAQVVGWFTGDPDIGQFRSGSARDAYVSAYQEALATMPAPARTLDVPTSRGVVRVYEWVNPQADGAPVVLLPGRASGVPMWSQNLPGLLEHRTVYALDALGDAGLSAQSAPITSAADRADWIDETLAGLGLGKVHVVGHSFGAASAAALAVHRPQRVATLTLLDPAFVLNYPPLSTFAWSVPATLPFLPQSWRDAAVARMAGEDPDQIASDDPVARMITAGGTGYSAALPTPKPLTDEQLRDLPMPVYVAIADGSPITKGQESVDRAGLIPDAQARLWPNTTHSLPMQVPDELAAELGDFWNRHDG